MISEVFNALLLTYIASEYLVISNSSNSNRVDTVPNRQYAQQTNHHHSNNSTSTTGSTSCASSRYTQLVNWIKYNPFSLSWSRITILVTVGIVNVLDRVTGATDMINIVLSSFFHIPKVFFVAILYFGALYMDINRNCCSNMNNMNNNDNSNTTNNENRSHTVKKKLDFYNDFVPRVGIAIVKVLPMYPLLAILISFGFLFIITLFENLHLPLEYLNWPIYYGTLYGPFSYIYYDIKQQIVTDQKYMLPTAISSKSIVQHR